MLAASAPAEAGAFCFEAESFPEWTIKQMEPAGPYSAELAICKM
jgi:hypothetical protein